LGRIGGGEADGTGVIVNVQSDEQKQSSARPGDRLRADDMAGHGGGGRVQAQ